jgi:hypothetical protein
MTIMGRDELFDALSAAGLFQVTVAFEGDDYQHEVKAMSNDGSPTMLDDSLDELLGNIVEDGYPDWGADGDVLIFDVPTRLITLEEEVVEVKRQVTRGF